MTLLELKKEIAELEPADQDEIVSYIGQLKARQDPAYEREMERRLDDRDPDHWVRLEDLEAEFAGS